MTPIPARNSTSYHAADYLHRVGPQSELDLFAAVHFGSKPHLRVATLERAIFGGWLVRTGGLIGLSDVAREHFDGEPEVKKYVGEVAGPRKVDLMNRPSLNRKYMPNARGIRADIPDWSVRIEHSFFTKA